MIEKLKKFTKQHDVRQQCFMNFGNPARILDLGCGSGYNSVILKNIYTEAEIYGVDLLEKKDVPEFINYTKINLDSDMLPYPDNFFDAIIFVHVIEHLISPWCLGKEIRRVLKKDGTIYIETPNWTAMFVPSFGFKREQHNPFNFYDDPTHVKPWSKHGLFEFLYQGCELRVKKIGTVRNWIKIPFDIPIIIWGFIKGNRSSIVSSFWNLYGWCIYGIGIKD